jgi:glutathione S-transferase
MVDFRFKENPLKAKNKLYSFVDADRSGRARWMLCELDLNYSEQRLDWRVKQHKSAEYRQINPMSLVPGLEIEGITLFESSGICCFLADQYPEKSLAPHPDSKNRPAYISWLFFAATTLENKIHEAVRWHGSVQESHRFDEAVENLRKVLDPLESRLSQQNYINGSDFSAVDVVAGLPLASANRCGILDGYPEVIRYVKRLSQRPAAQKAKVFSATA